MSGAPFGTGDEAHRRAHLYDGFHGATAAFLFSVALGIASVSVPLLAIHAGYDIATVGLLIASSAVAQIVSRLFMGHLMHSIPDKYFVVAAALLLSASCGMLALSAGMGAFVISQLLQGIARAFFWTGSQTHAVRMASSAVNGLTVINLTSGVGSLLGPALAGFLSIVSIEYSLLWGSIVGLLAFAPAALLVKLKPFTSSRDPSGQKPVRIWRRPGVFMGCMMGMTAGSWRGLLNSYVPVVLTQAGHTTAAIGLLVSTANASTLVGSALSPSLRNLGMKVVRPLSVVCTGLGIALVGMDPGTFWVSALFLGLSGLGAGVLQTIGPALTTEGVHVEERGDAIAIAGTFRAVALFLAPLMVSGAVLILPAGIALAAAGVLMSVPALGKGRSRRHLL